jgi:hypothetical protein
MHRVKSSFTIFLILLCGNLYSATTQNTTQSKSPFSSSSKRPIELDFVLSTEQTRSSSTHESTGYYNKMDTSFLYKFNDDDQVRLYGSSIYMLNKEAENQFDWDLTEIMYRRKNILTQSKHGVSLEFEGKSYYILDNERRHRYGYNGAFIPQLIVKRRWKNGFSLEGKVRHHFYYRKNSKDSTSRGETRLYLTPTYALSHKLFLFNEVKYKHNIKGAKYFSHYSRSYMSKKKDTLQLHPGIMYMINRKAMLELYTETYLMRSHDGELINPDYSRSLVFGGAFYLTAF